MNRSRGAAPRGRARGARAIAAAFVRLLRASMWILPPALFAAWAMRFAGALFEPAIPAFGDVERQLAYYRAELWRSAAQGALLLAAWAAGWSLARRLAAPVRAAARPRRAARPRQPQNLTL